MNNNINTGVFELTSNSDHIHIAGTEENDIELVSIKGNSRINRNSCTYDRFREGIDAQLYFYKRDYFNSYVNIYGNRFIYDSKGEVHELLNVKQTNTGGLLNTLPNALTNNDNIYIKIRINENTLESTDVATLKFINVFWDLKTLEPGIYSSVFPMTVVNIWTWLLDSNGRQQFFELQATNNSGQHKKFDFEILEISLSEDDNMISNTDEFESLDINNISIQENSLDKINEYKLNNDSACRLNIVNKKILEIQDMLI